MMTFTCGPCGGAGFRIDSQSYHSASLSLKRSTRVRKTDLALGGGQYPAPNTLIWLIYEMLLYHTVSRSFFSTF